MKKNIVTTAVVTLTREQILGLAKTADPGYAADAGMLMLSSVLSNLAPGKDGILSLTFRNIEDIDTEKTLAKVDAILMDSFTSEQRRVVRERLSLAGRDSYTQATAEVQAKVEELVIIAWNKSGQLNSLSVFALPWYVDNLFAQYRTNGRKFPFETSRWEPAQEQVKAVLDELNSRFSFQPRTDAQKDQIVKDLLQAWHDAGESGSPQDFAFPWYRDNRDKYNA